MLGFAPHQHRLAERGRHVGTGDHWDDEVSRRRDRARRGLTGRSIQLERDSQRVVQEPTLHGTECAAAPHERCLSDRQDVVAVRDALAVQPMLRPKRDLGSEPANRAGHEDDRDVRQELDRDVARDDDRRMAARARPVDVVDVTAVQPRCLLVTGLFGSSSATSLPPSSRPTRPTH